MLHTRKSVAFASLLRYVDLGFRCPHEPPFLPDHAPS
jgi:hypothetical protein